MRYICIRKYNFAYKFFISHKFLTTTTDQKTQKDIKFQFHFTIYFWHLSAVKNITVYESKPRLYLFTRYEPKKIQCMSQTFVCISLAKTRPGDHHETVERSKHLGLPPASGLDFLSLTVCQFDAIEAAVSLKVTNETEWTETNGLFIRNCIYLSVNVLWPIYLLEMYGFGRNLWHASVKLWPSHVDISYSVAE